MSWNNVFGELEFIALLSTLWLLFKCDFEFSRKTFEPEIIADKAVRQDIIGILCFIFCKSSLLFMILEVVECH